MSEGGSQAKFLTGVTSRSTFRTLTRKPYPAFSALDLKLSNNLTEGKYYWPTPHASLA